MIVKLRALLVPPPGVGLNTVTAAIPTVAILAAGTNADNCVALIYVVVSAAPFHLMAEVVTKLVPLVTNVNEPEPAVAILGDKPVSVGRGLVLVIVNVSELLVPPPGVGVKTVIAAVPTDVMFTAGTVAVNCEALT